jgi:hypothetical protein
MRTLNESNQKPEGSRGKRSGSWQTADVATPLAFITLSCGGNSVKRIYQLHWTGSPSVSRDHSSVFFHPSSVGPAIPPESATRHLHDEQHPRRLRSAFADREGVFLFLGGA